MAVYEYALANRKRDLSEVLSTVIANEPRFISSFPRRGIYAVARKHEWLEDQIAGRSLTVTSITDSTVTASADDVAKIRAARACVGARDAKRKGHVASARSVGDAHRGSPHRNGRDRKARVEEDHRVGARRAVRSDLGGRTRTVWELRVSVCYWVKC